MTSIFENFSKLESELSMWTNNRKLLIGPFRNRINERSKIYANRIQEFYFSPRRPTFYSHKMEIPDNWILSKSVHLNASHKSEMSKIIGDFCVKEYGQKRNGQQYLGDFIKRRQRTVKLAKENARTGAQFR